MSKFNRLLAPNFWIAVFSIFGLIGVGFVVAGRVFGEPRFVTVGQVLIVPLVLGAIALVVVVIPILIYANRKYAAELKIALDLLPQRVFLTRMLVYNRHRNIFARWDFLGLGFLNPTREQWANLLRKELLLSNEFFNMDDNRYSGVNRNHLYLHIYFSCI